jgi:hypothetical protein
MYKDDRRNRQQRNQTQVKIGTGQPDITSRSKRGLGADGNLETQLILQRNVCRIWRCHATTIVGESKNTNSSLQRYNQQAAGHYYQFRRVNKEMSTWRWRSDLRSFARPYRHLEQNRGKPTETKWDTKRERQSSAPQSQRRNPGHENCRMLPNRTRHTPASTPNHFSPIIVGPQQMEDLCN